MKEILKHLVEHVTLPEDAYLDQDDEILEIFVEELEEIFEQLQASLDQWLNDESKDKELVNVRRYFHTLKGSGRMVGAKRSEHIETVAAMANHENAEEHAVADPIQIDESAVETTPTSDESLISETLTIFVEESEEHLATIKDFLHLEQHTPEQYNRLIRALHTLRGSSSMAHIQDVFEASVIICMCSKQTGDQDTQLAQIYQKFNDAWERYDFQHQYQQDHQSQAGLVTQLVDLEIDLLLDAEFEFDKRAQVEYPEYFQQLIQQAQILVDHTNNRASQGIHDFSLALKDGYTQIIAKPDLLNTDYAFEIFSKAHQEFIHLFDTLASGQRVSLSGATQAILDELHDYVHQEIDVDQIQIAEPSTEPAVQHEAVSDINAVETGNHYVLTQINLDKQNIDSAQSQREFDADVLDIFIEEADELLVGMDHDLNTWSSHPDDTTALNNLMRYLHTLKGGANMVQATYIGLIAHELETIYERVIKGQLKAGPQVIQSIRLIQDDVADRIQLIREKSIDYPATHILEVLQHIDQQQFLHDTNVEIAEKAQDEIV
ncbi:hypothetical protein FQR65_LT17707 [Abscondita terminalis]|nr:hypothetical protein FQR65_LT17707 [Abscondita terminalis]